MESTLTISTPIYRKEKKGGFRTWQFEVEGDKWRTISGAEGGKLVTSAWTVSEPKNGGRANATTGEQQALAEAEAELASKLKREYRRTKDELDTVKTGPMLAKDFAKAAPFKFPVHCQPKLDGIRLILSKDEAMTRDLQPHHPHVVAHIREALTHVFDQHPNLVLDGELYNHDFKSDFNSIVRLVRKENVSEEELARVREYVQFHVYDMPSNRYTFQGRNQAIFGMFQIYNLMAENCPVKYVPTSWHSNREGLDKKYAEYMEQGYEGQMIRLEMPYESDTRSKGLMKRKEFDSGEYPLLRIEEGEGNWAGFAKRIIYRMPDGSEGKAGMRGNQAFAKELLTKEIGSKAQATIRHFGYTPDGAHRFPVAIDFHWEGRKD
jgi:DNA ligase-1